MEERIRNKLIELARSKTTMSYSQLNDQLELGFDFSLGQHRDEIGEILGEISEHEHSKGRPLISALIIHKGPDKEQGDGFYKLCQRIFGTPWQDLKANKDFEIEKIRECFSFWKDNENYKKFKADY